MKGWEKEEEEASVFFTTYLLSCEGKKRNEKEKSDRGKKWRKITDAEVKEIKRRKKQIQDVKRKEDLLETENAC